MRFHISNDDHPPIDQYLSTGVLPYIIDFLDVKYFEHTDLLNECSWIVVNVCSGSEKNVDFSVSLNIIPKAINLLAHPNESIQENALWILANIAGTSIEYKDILINFDVVEKISNFMKKSSSNSLVSNILWLVANLTRNPLPSAENVSIIKKILF